jgi:hypothetical protein
MLTSRAGRNFSYICPTMLMRYVKIVMDYMLDNFNYPKDILKARIRGEEKQVFSLIGR